MSCPRGFDSIGSGCYSFSRQRMGWIEAKKSCELDGAHLVNLETEREMQDILDHLVGNSRRRRSRFEYWTSGNDINEENNWVWGTSGGRRQSGVPDFGWLDPPLPSAEENCLTWSATVISSGRRMSSSWHSDSCCNNVRFICELDN